MPTSKHLFAMALGFVLFSFASCGPSSAQRTSNASGGLAQIIRAATPEEAKKIADNSEITCGESDGCPLSVGLLTSVNGSYISLCTATLIADNIVLTNSHCIPDPYKNDGESCVGKIFLQLPASGELEFEKLGCSEILAFSDLTKTRQDYAVIKLAAPAKRSPIEITREGLKNQKKYTIWKMINDNHEGRIQGRMEKETCTVYQHSHYLTNNSSDLSSIHVHGGCTVIPGTSGSPLLNTESKLAGINQGHFSEIETIEKEWSTAKIPLDTPLKMANILTNAACLDLRDQRFEAPMKCLHVPLESEQADASTTTGMSSVEAEFLPLQSHEVNQWMVEHDFDSGLRWSAKAASLATIKNYETASSSEFPSYTTDLVPIPICIEDTMKFNDLLGTSRGKVNFQSHLWRYSIRYSDFLVPYYRSSKSAENRQFTLVVPDYASRPTIFAPYSAPYVIESTMQRKITAPDLKPCE